MPLFSRKRSRTSRQASTSPEALRLLSGYVLHMSITALGDGDITPLYEEYVNDPRLGGFERQELTIAFRILRTRRPSPAPAASG